MPEGEPAPGDPTRLYGAVNVSGINSRRRGTVMHFTPRWKGSVPEWNVDRTGPGT
jgi:hypothetical protein